MTFDISLLDLFGKLLAVVVVAIVMYFVPMLRDWLEAHAGVAQTEELLVVISSFVRAADQLFHDADPDGHIRKEYVIDKLKEYGIDITEAIMAMIEGAVFDVNHEIKLSEDINTAESENGVDA